MPGRVFGRTTGAELNECAEYLSDLVSEHALPEKVMVYHQLHINIVRQEKALTPADGVAIVKSIDGIGPPGAKIETYHAIVRSTPKFVHKGFKLFYEEDADGGSRLMTPAECSRSSPVPSTCCTSDAHAMIGPCT